MKPTHFLYPLCFALLLLAASWIGTGVSGIKQTNQPNIILMMADDMGYSDLGCMGSEISTPNIDKLARNGLLVTDFYNAGRCCPTRASLLTALSSAEPFHCHQRRYFQCRG